MKKIISLLLALVLALGVFSIAAVSAAATETAPTQTPPNYSANKIYFYANPKYFKNYDSIRFYLFDRNDEIIPWGAGKGKMTNEGNNFWSFDLDGKGYKLEAGKTYGCCFSADWTVSTNEMFIDAQNIGDIAYPDGTQEENSFDSTMLNYEAKWKSGHNSSIKTITTLGNVTGTSYWPGEDAVTLLSQFISSWSAKGLQHAVEHNNKSEQQTIDDIAIALGMSLSQVQQAVQLACDNGAYIPDWQAERSPLYNGAVKPAAPTLTLSDVTSNSIRAQWNWVSNAAKFILYYKKSTATNWSSITTTSISHVLNDLEPGVSYSVQVQSVGANNLMGGYSHVATATTPKASDPQAKPGAPTVTLSNKSNGIRAEWKAVTGAVKYIVYYRPNGDSTWSSAETSDTCMSLLHLMAGTTYAVQVQSVGVNELKGEYSAVNRLVYIPQVQPAVTLSNKSNGILAEWSSLTDATGYVVYYRENTAASWQSAETTNNYYPLINPTVGKTYAVQVQPVFGSAKGRYSAVNCLTYDPKAPFSLTPPNYTKNKIYFYADPVYFKNFKNITVYFYNHETDSSITTWGSNKGKMTNEGNNFWSYQPNFPFTGSLGCIFTADWSVSTNDLIFDVNNMGDVAYPDGSEVENPYDSNKMSYEAKWKSGHNGSPVTITSLGNVTGNIYWPGENAESLLYDFIRDGGVSKAAAYTGKTEQKVVDDIAAALGLTLNQIEQAVSDAAAGGVYVGWAREDSPLYRPAVKPASPTLSITAQAKAISASWNKVANAVSYIVYYKKTGDSNWLSVKTTATGYLLNGLTPGTNYSVQVQSVGANNLMGYYSAVKTTTIPSKPAAPTLTTSNKSNGIRAEWNKVSGAVKYIVFFRKDADSKWSSVETVNTYYPLLNLTAGTQYAVQVQSVGANNLKGYYSNVSRLTYIPQVQPVVTLSNKSNGIRAEWNKVGGATKYVVYYKKTADNKWSSAETANNYFPLLGITAGTQYAVQVQPVFGSAKGLYSAVKTLAYIPQVQPVLTLSNKSNGIRAEWNKVGGVTKYIVYYRKNADSKWSSVETVNNYYPLLGLTAGTQYAVQVQAVFGSAKGLYSNVARLAYQPTK